MIKSLTFILEYAILSIDSRVGIRSQQICKTDRSTELTVLCGVQKASERRVKYTVARIGRIDPQKKIQTYWPCRQSSLTSSTQSGKTGTKTTKNPDRKV